jgi:uncharacterized RDD family membrane protein YckC
VRACAETLSERPLTAFLAGLLVLLFVGPVSLLLVMSVVGVFVVPFLYCAILLAGIVGRIGVARRVGMSVVREDADGNRLQALRSFAIGFAAVVVIYMIPALGFVAWALIGVFGLGAATLALVAGYRQEHPVQAPALPSSNTTPNAPPEPLRDVATAAAPLLEDSGPVDLASFPRASFGRRLSAFLLDVVLVAIVAHLVGPFGDSRNHAFLLLLLAYHIGFWAWKSTTVGGIICQLRITRVHGQPLRFGDAVVRGLSSIFSLVVVGLGCLWILKDAERQAWHDRIAGTYVVIVPRHWPV